MINPMTCYIYRLVTDDGNTYIGKTNDLKTRIANHKSTTMKGKNFHVEILQTIPGRLSWACLQEELHFIHLLKPTLNKGVITKSSKGRYHLNRGVAKSSGKYINPVT